ncbi:hypothetical protein [Aestuariibaculum sediminum]|uniref:Fibronectin type-III domain-containing protein n=1 Tax=Aestuariibaculum sediminum TaxID=2770637 RepID=A0A8J6UI41_9FLAO|nr:hypothetical protein [Aestuariibaculum sediminum]MBD0833791.1 hypothetical protein [Aestuariibaculum sediminum]
MYYRCCFILFCLVVANCDDIIEVDDITDRNVTVLAPTESSVVTGKQIIFTWEKIEEAESFHLQVATPTFSNASQVMVDTLVKGNFFTKDTLVDANYEWRVRAENSGYQTPYTYTRFIVSN